ncbi:helix-turn-helix domain-containing protein [Dinoroseobacter sp. S124A]|uniref:arsenate reductase/protein-tyrosine-phosphatase family protein n=1 Tax=Dinoroseobacter sp. S124A TaxID=3415128 RepID=UPI003C7D57D1
MELIEASDALDALSHPGRLGVFRLLVRRGPEGVRPSEMAAALSLKPNTLSVYLSALQQAGLVHSRREGRAVIYAAEMGRMGDLLSYLVADCCRGRPDLCLPDPGPAAEPRVRNVLFLCTGNSARSIFAEQLLTDLGEGRFAARSAGRMPTGRVNPHTLEVLAEHGHGVEGLRSKPVSAIQTPDAADMDFVFTVCDAAANEECAPWPGLPLSAHWGMPDPAQVQGDEAETSRAFAETYRQMRDRIERFVALPFQSLDRLALQARLDEIGRPAP